MVVVLSYENDCCVGSGVADATGRPYSIQVGKADVQQDQVWLHLLHFFNGFQSIPCLCDDT